jgi:hypothetical protein
MRNKEFAAAFDYVAETYPDLFHPSLLHVELVPSSRHRAFGQWSLNEDGTSQITIRNGRQSACEFVDTIVHELNHLQYFVSGRSISDKHEEAACLEAGNIARSVAFKKWPDGWAYPT